MSKAKHPGGRPLKFKTVNDLQTAIDAYFAMCLKLHKPFTITGLAVALDTSRETLLDYQNRDKFSYAITRAKDMIHAYAEESLWQPRIGQGVIFNLTNNWGWKNKSEVDQNHIFPSVAELAKKARDERAKRSGATAR